MDVDACECCRKLTDEALCYAGPERRVRLRDCVPLAPTLAFVSSYFIFDLAWLRLQHTPCQQLILASHPWKKKKKKIHTVPL